jgi:hypothetical protein
MREIKRYPFKLFNCTHIELIVAAEQEGIPVEFVTPFVYELEKISADLVKLINLYKRGLINKNMSVDQVLSILKK